MNPASIPPGKVNAIRARYLDGESLNSIATNLNVGRTTVRKYTRDLPRRTPYRLAPKVISEIQAMRTQGVKRSAVAAKLGVSVTSVKNYEPPNCAAARRRKAAPPSPRTTG